MKCPNHLTRDVAGYCCVCGSFYCQDCFTRHEGNLYCKKHYKPIGDKIEHERKLTEGRKRRARNALVVHFRNGRRAQGACRTMNLRNSGFHLECEDESGVATGETLRIRFEDLKCICHVKSYDGNFDPNEDFQACFPHVAHIVTAITSSRGFANSVPAVSVSLPQCGIVKRSVVPISAQFVTSTHILLACVTCHFTYKSSGYGTIQSLLELSRRDASVRWFTPIEA